MSVRVFEEANRMKNGVQLGGCNGARPSRRASGASSGSRCWPSKFGVRSSEFEFRRESLASALFHFQLQQTDRYVRTCSVRRVRSRDGLSLDTTQASRRFHRLKQSRSLSRCLYLYPVERCALNMALHVECRQRNNPIINQLSASRPTGSRREAARAH